MKTNWEKMITRREKLSRRSYARLKSGDEEGQEDFSRKGFVPVLVGNTDKEMERLEIPIKLINHPSLVSLLDVYVQEFGYNQQGVLRISCDAEIFKEMLKTISRKK